MKSLILSDRLTRRIIGDDLVLTNLVTIRVTNLKNIFQNQSNYGTCKPYKALKVWRYLIKINNFFPFTCLMAYQPSVIQPLRPTPEYINFFKPILFLANNSSSAFCRGISHFFTATKNATDRVGEKEQTNNMDLGQLQAQERGFCVTILCSFSCICRLSCACIFRETSSKATRSANSSLTVFSHCLLRLTVLPLDSYLTPTGLFCRPLSTVLSGYLCQLPPLFSRTFLSTSTSGLVRDSSSSPLFRFCAKTDKEIVCLHHHPYSVTHHRLFNVKLIIVKEQ